jgi:glycosyltransferase involved in cell wall biosynthesis
MRKMKVRVSSAATIGKSQDARFMRCLFIVSDFSKDRIRALPWKYVYEVTKCLIAMGNDVTLLTDTPCPSLTFAERNHCFDIPVRLVRRTRQFPTASYIMDPSEVRHTIEEFNPDLVYLFGDPLSGYYVKRLKGLGIPLLLHVTKNLHSMSKLLLSINDYFSLSPYFYFLNSPLSKFMVRLLNQREIAIVTVPSLSVKRSLENCGVRGSKIKVLPVAFDRDILNYDCKGLDRNRVLEKLGFCETDFVVVYFGAPHIRRGINELIHAISTLKDKIPVKLLLLLRLNPKESSPLRRFYERRILKLNVADKVRLIADILPRNKLMNFLKASNVIALPFKYIDEEPPMTILEAMALGKPIITTRIGSLPEIVGDERGLLVEPGRSYELAQAIYDVYRRPYKAYMLGVKAKEYALNLCDWSELAVYLLNLFDFIVSRPQFSQGYVEQTAQG